MTHHVKQSSFAGVRQCYSYVRHTHTHTQKHTKSIFFPPSSSTFPKFSLAASSTAAHIISREWHAAPKNTQRFSTVSRSSCQATFLCKEPIHPTNLLQTFFFSYTLQGQICNVKLCIVPVSYLVLTRLVKTWHVVFYRPVPDQLSVLDTWQLDTNYKNPIKTDFELNWDV